MRACALLSVVLLVGCGPLLAPGPEHVHEVSVKPVKPQGIPERPQKSVQPLPSVPSAPSSAPVPQLDVPSNFRIVSVNSDEMAPHIQEIRKLSEKLEPVLPGMSRQLNWVLQRRIEFFQGSLIALLREAKLNVLTKSDSIFSQRFLVHHADGILISSKKWNELDAKEKSSHLLAAILDHLLQFEAGEKRLCESYEVDAQKCKAAWAYTGERGTKASRFKTLVPVAEHLLIGHSYIMNAKAILSFLEPYGYQAPYMTRGSYKGSDILIALRELDGKKLKLVEVSGAQLSRYQSAELCEFQILSDKLVLTLTTTPASVPLELSWSIKDDESFETIYPVDTPQIMSFFATGAGYFTEIKLSRMTDAGQTRTQEIFLNLQELDPATKALKATQLRCKNTGSTR